MCVFCPLESQNKVCFFTKGNYIFFKYYYYKVLAYRVKQNCDVHDFRNVENEFVVDHLSECRHSHEIDRRLFVRRQSQKYEKRFPQNVAQDSSNIGI